MYQRTRCGTTNRAGLIQSVARSSGNQRRYQESDIEWVRFLLRLRETGMPIARMRSYAQLRIEGDRTLVQRLELLSDHQAALQQQIRTLRAHGQALQAKIRIYHRMITAGETEGDNP